MSAEIENCRKMPILPDKLRQFPIMHIKYFPNRKCIVFFKGIVL